MVKKYCDHIGIFTNNPKRLVNFYIDKLGLEFLNENLIPFYVMKEAFGINSEAKVAKLATDNFMIEVFQLPKLKFKKAFKDMTGISHWALFVGNRLRFIKELKKKKVKVIKIERNGSFAYFIADPDGNLIELRE